jgi:CRISPR/Cas system CSM-associated protein Csm3 (group 7 of RAMP superfamily)
MANTKTSGVKDAVVRRLYARGTWKLDSVAHFGGAETGVADMCLLLDADGNPFIPGASVAGAARSFLARQSEPWAEYKKAKESRELKRFFGGADKDDTMSALIVADASCKQKQPMTSIRDGVRVDTQSGSAADKAKFDVEVVERGTEFELRFECIIRDADDQPKLKELFLALLHGFQQGDIRLGARTRRGYGRGKVESWEIRDLQMDNQEDVMAWLRDDAWSRPESSLTPSALPSDQRSYFHIAADFELRTSLLIRSSSADPDAPDEVPDMTHLHSNGKPVVPGTSFAGAFRHRAALIADALCWRKDSADNDAVCEMFGPVHEQKRDKAQQEPDQVDPEENAQEVHDEERDETQTKELWASRVWIEERLVKRVKLQWQDRVAIDRFTGGSLDGALFNEKPAYPLALKDIKKQARPNLRLRLTLEEPDSAEIGLLLLTLRDFWHSHAALGGETSNGRGTLRGIKARLQFKRSDSSDTEVWKFSHKDKRMTLDEGDAAFLECCVKKAQGYSNRPDGSRRPGKEGETNDA